MTYCSRVLAGALIVSCSAAAIAQTKAVDAVALEAPAEAIPAPASVSILNSTSNILRSGTRVALKTSEPLTTEGKKLRVGQRLQLEVADAVMLHDQIVIPVGSPATGEITDVRNKGMWGKSGRINARVLFVRVNGRQIRLSGGF